MAQYDQQQPILGEGCANDSQQRQSDTSAKERVEDRSGHDLEGESFSQVFPRELHPAPTQQHTGLLRTGRPVYSTDVGIVPLPPNVEEDAHKKKRVTEKVRDALHTVKDTISGHRTQDVSSPTSSEPATVASIASPTSHATEDDHEKVGCLDKVKDLITRQKPGHGTGTGASASDVHPHLASPGGAAPLATPTHGYVATQPFCATGAQAVGRHDCGFAQQNTRPVPMSDADHREQRLASDNAMHSSGVVGGVEEGEGWPQPVHPSQAPKAAAGHGMLHI